MPVRRRSHVKSGRISAFFSDALEFRRVVVTGEYDFAAEVTVGPRSCEGESGSYVLTPMQLENGKRILINRGWIPRDLLGETFVWFFFV
jgi:surfeit locus 1 family protein